MFHLRSERQAVCQTRRTVLEGLCQTASGFLMQADSPEFAELVRDENLPPVAEIKMLLERTFGGKLIKNQT